MAQELIDDVPLYVNAKEVCREDGSVEALELNYLTFYAHNGSCALGSLAASTHSWSQSRINKPCVRPGTMTL